MALSEQYLHIDEIHPIDIVEHMASDHQWEFDRVADDQIAMAVDGQWRSYAITLAWSPQDEILRLICTFEMDPPKHRRAALMDALNAVNDVCWAGGFSFWEDENLMVFRYGLVLAGGQSATPDQIDMMISAAVASSERFYPAFQLVTWGERDTRDAMQVAIAEVYGHA